jgi:hypothetical protein
LHVSSLEWNPELVSKSRFVKLEPDALLSKEIELTKAVRRFVAGHGSVLGAEAPAHSLIVAYEEVVRFEVPKTAKTLTVDVTYGPGMDGRAAFSQWFRYDPSEVGLVTCASSKPVKISLED